LPSRRGLFHTYTDPIILEFLLGAVIGRLWLAGRLPSRVAGLVLVTVALAGFSFVGVTYIGFGPLLLGPLAAALVAGVLALERGGWLPDMHPLGWLGDGSYSIYLWHTLAISVVAKTAGLLMLPPMLAFALALVAGTAIGLALYELLEKPLGTWLRRRRLAAAAAVRPAAV
jgi:exopolysaccharide production protein ExoZ